jgi:predicted nucleic-acid-binding Zn-ribbon protein
MSLEGICPKCSSHYYGWALGSQKNQLCVKCGSSLVIRKDDVLIRSGFSPFKANEYNTGSSQDHWEDLRNKNLMFYLTMN